MLLHFTPFKLKLQKRKETREHGQTFAPPACAPATYSHMQSTPHTAHTPWCCICVLTSLVGNVNLLHDPIHQPQPASPQTSPPVQPFTLPSVQPTDQSGVQPTKYLVTQLTKRSATTCSSCHLNKTFTSPIQPCEIPVQQSAAQQIPTQEKDSQLLNL